MSRVQHTYMLPVSAVLTGGVDWHPQERVALRAELGKCQVVCMSYEVLRSDIGWVEGIDWDYCILDEGQTIKNAKSKVLHG